MTTLGTPLQHTESKGTPVHEKQQEEAKRDFEFAVMVKKFNAGAGEREKLALAARLDSDHQLLVQQDAKLKQLEQIIAGLEDARSTEPDFSFLSRGSVLSLFDLYDKTETTAKVRGNAYAFCNAGVFSNISAGTATIDSNITFSANTYIYIKFDRATPAVTLEVGASIPAGDDDTEYYPLWYVPWNSTTSKVNWKGRIWLGDSIHMEAMS